MATSTHVPTSHDSPLRSIRGVTEREERYRTLFDASYQPLQAFARRRTSGADADDLVAEVLTVAWRRLDDIPADRPLAWLYGVAHRQLANQRRSNDRRLRLVQRMRSQRPSAASETAEAEPVLHAMAQLRAEDQDVLRLAAWEDLTAAEIAVVLGCTPNAATLRLSRARARLRAAMTRPSSSRTQERRKVVDG